jgi:hypothetical protein
VFEGFAEAVKGSETPMKPTPDKTAQLGDLVALAFEEAQRLTSDPRRAAALAAAAIRRILLVRGDIHLMRLLTSEP